MRRKITSPKKMGELWEEYKANCDSREAMTHNFSQKSGQFVSKKLERAVTYTVLGFCRYIGLARQNFYETYCGDPRYHDITTRIREECEVDAREKFELGLIDPKLAPLWMSKYGYGVKAEVSAEEDGREGPDPLTASIKESIHAIKQTD